MSPIDESITRQSAALRASPHPMRQGASPVDQPLTSRQRLDDILADALSVEFVESRLNDVNPTLVARVVPRDWHERQLRSNPRARWQGADPGTR